METYNDMKNRHVWELTELAELEGVIDPERMETQALRLREKHSREIRAAFDADRDGSGFVRQMMLDGVYYGMSLEEILKEDGIDLATFRDCDRA